MSEELVLNNDFLLELFYSCLKNKSVLEITLAHVKENYLPLENHKKILRELRSQFKTEGKFPTTGTLKLAFRKERVMLELIDEIKEVTPPDVDTVLYGLESFVKQSKFVEMYDEMGELFNRDKKKEAFEKFEKGAEDMRKFNLSSQKMRRVFGDFHERQRERVSGLTSKPKTKVPFGIDELDMKTQGGPETGEYVLFLGDAKAGKSFALAHCGMSAARRGFGVAHFQLEGTERQVLDRYDSAWSGVLYHDIKAGEFPSDKYKVHEKIIRNIGKGEIYVDAPEKFGAMSVGDVYQKVVNLQKEHDIKLVVIDYMDLLVPDHHTRYGPNDERFKQQTVSRLLKEMAMELNVVVISATQASSISSELLEDPDFVIKREHLSEDKGKVRPVDMLITINKTSEERKANICRLYTEALREHNSGDIIYIKQSLAYSRFYNRKATLEAFELE